MTEVVRRAGFGSADGIVNTLVVCCTVWCIPEEEDGQILVEHDWYNYLSNDEGQEAKALPKYSCCIQSMFRGRGAQFPQLTRPMLFPYSAFPAPSLIYASNTSLYCRLYRLKLLPSLLHTDLHPQGTLMTSLQITPATCFRENIRYMRAKSFDTIVNNIQQRVGQRLSLPEP